MKFTDLQKISESVMGLTEEQKLRMEQKRAEAVARMKSKSASGQTQSTNQISKATTDRSIKSDPIKFSSKDQSISSSNVQTNSLSVISNKQSENSSPLSDKQRQIIEERRKAAKTKLNFERDKIRSSSSSSVFSLSDEQKRLIEERKKAAQLKMQQKKEATVTSSPKSKPNLKHNELSKPINAANFYTLPPRVVRGACTLVTNNRFEMDVGYHKQLIDTVKTVSSAQYNAGKKSWSFHITDHENVIKRVASLKPDVEIAPLPAWILNTFRKPRDAIPVDLSSVEKHILDNLMPFQKEGVKFGVTRGGRILLADDMGLGKTVQALALASYYSHTWPVLIVCQSNLKFGWKEAVLRWLPESVAETEVGVISSGKDYIGSDQFCIISYELVSKKQRELLDKRFKFIILDESHSIKDFKSARTKALEPLLKVTKHLLLLSGTPALSRPIELYPQINALVPSLFKYPSEFGNRYCDGKIKRIGDREIPDFSGSSHMQELSLLLGERCMIRRLKTEVLGQLPSKKRICVILDPAGVESKTKEMDEGRKKTEKKGLNGSQMHQMVVQWFNTTANAKLKAVKVYIKDLLSSSSEKFLVFVHHQVMLKAIAEVVSDAGVGHIVIDGRVSSEARKVSVDRFQTEDNIRVAVLSITAANAGITLTAASLVIFAELFWNPGVLTQAEDRAHRIGQTEAVRVQYLVARDTADDVMWPIIQKKLYVLNEAGLSKDNFEDSEARVMEDTRQMKIEDSFNNSRGKEDENEDFDTIWADLLEDDMKSQDQDTGVESQAKRIRLE